ncbi:MAG: 4-hydroxy-tetrahydrodipicolinate reductase [Buchnera aphidicola (Pentalonia nigronervosa)]|jgi:4-hydroxy-tetrahydrodipicolinate reductase|uniref:4-hydroxy-tetrahydrodipicolinate reductase n=1 Tax=Buchnera aphidicola (Pentalonia nigronervosa) TaxID=1309793 RepID=A0A7H1AZH0_9GAMM|nr:MAG: 4-hydroxy-tetrahydrodipicolinate reductase [Buchnera aphidicola (Pentalonia nigronervosa)]
MKKIRIAISGPMGRMGQMLVKEVQKNKHTCLSTVIVRKNSPFVNQDIGEKIGIGAIGVLIRETLNIEKNDFDILIDFTNPSSTLNYLKYCSKFKKNIVIGTTGFTQQEQKTIKLYSQKIGIILSSNFSIGINLLFQLIEHTTKVIGNNFDIDILETHHRNKIDSPSGTALSMAKVILKSMNWKNLKNHSIYHTNGIIQKRDKNKIGFSIVRSGNIVGKHTIMFTGNNEQIKISHTAFNRTNFSKGAVQSAIWISNKNKGLFNMLDVIS